MEADQADDAVVLAGDFFSGSCRFRVTVTENHVCWEEQTLGRSKSWSKFKRDQGRVKLPWCDVVIAHMGKQPIAKKQHNPGDEECFTIHYIVHQPNNIWRCKQLVFEGKKGTLQEWIDKILEKCQPERPRRLLAVINPISGIRKQSRQLFDKIVSPLFALAQIEVDIIVTERYKHAEEIGKTYDISTIDGIVVMGGDGIFQELVHSLLPRIQEEAGIDFCNSKTEFKPFPVPVGMVPTGTGNGIAYSSYGCYDVETAALHIITGQKHRSNIMTIHESGKFISCSGIILEFGFLADVMAENKPTRFLRAVQYSFQVLKVFLKKKPLYSVQVEYLPLDSDQSKEDTANSENDETEAVDLETGWKTFEGHVIAVSALPFCLNSSETSDKLKPIPDSPGFTMITAEDTGEFNYMKYIFRIKSLKKDSFDLDFLHCHQVKAFRLKCLRREDDGTASQEHDRYKDNLKKLFVDGEIRELHGNEQVEVRLQHHVIETFSSHSSQLTQ